MPIRNQNWYDLQATRRYPLDERSTGVDDAGGLLRDSILVDCHVRFPSTFGSYAFLQGITITQSLVTVVFGAANTVDDVSGPSVAAINLLRADVVQNVHYPLQALVPGVAGWVVFGAGVEESFTARYSGARQSLLEPRCARAYAPLPIPTLKKTGQSTALQGLVTIVADAPLTCTHEEATVNDQTVRALVFRLVGDSNGGNGLNGVNALQYFLGPCGQRPESHTCQKPAIETINGIQPDCDGNINIFCPGPDITNTSFANCGGLELATSIGLADACGARSIRVPTDKCNPSASEDQSWYNPIDQLPPDIVQSEDIPEVSQEDTCATTPVCADFNGTHTSFQVIRGVFAYASVKAPFGCAGNFPTHETRTEAELDLVDRTVYTSANFIETNIALFRNCASDWATGKTFETELKITNSGVNKNGGIVLNYLSPVPSLALPERYLIAQLDGDTNKLQIRRVNGAANVIEAETPFPVDPGAWYKLTVTPTNVGSAVSITATVNGLTAPEAYASLSTSLSWASYGDPTGAAGLIARRSAAYFTKFEIQN